MDPSHFRGSQPPTSHVLPGVPGHLPHFGFMEPQPIIPPSFFNDTLMAIHKGSATQRELLNNHYSDLKQDYNRMKGLLQSHGDHTDSVFMVFEQKLEEIKRGMLQSHEKQSADISDLGSRLDSLASGVATTAKTVDKLFAVFGTNIYVVQDPALFKSGAPKYNALPEVTHATTDQPSTEPEDVQEQPIELIPATILSNPESPSTSTDNLDAEEQDELYGGDTPMVSTPATEDPSIPPAGDLTTVPLSPPTIPIPEDIPTTPVSDCDPVQGPPSQDNFFEASSPLTPVSTPQSQNLEPQTPTEPPETETETDPAPADPASRKRKRRSQGRGALKQRKNRKLRSQAKQDDVYQVQQSEGDYMDPSIWPPMIEGDANSQRYVGCDRCAKWFHLGCVGLQEDPEDGLDWECPRCIRDSTRDAACVPRDRSEMCTRPGCPNPGGPNPRGEEYFMDRLLGRCYVASQNAVKYLVSYEGYSLEECSWEPPEHFSNDKIKEFLEWWATENDMNTLDPHSTIFLREAYVLARAGHTWAGDVDCSPVPTPTPPPS